MKSRKNRFLTVLLYLYLVSSCTNEKHFAGFDEAGWKNDKAGCNGKRLALKDNFDTIRPQLKGLSQAEILQVLGRPDFQQLYKRNQKFYIYFLEPGLQCQGGASQSRARTVVIRFNAVELASEVYYGTGKPE